MFNQFANKGLKIMLEKVKGRYYWPTISKDVSETPGRPYALLAKNMTFSLFGGSHPVQGDLGPEMLGILVF